MNILFLTSSSYSHIICLKSLIKHLLQNKESVFCISTIENKSLIEDFGAKFIQYPNYIVPVSIRGEIMEELDSDNMKKLKKDNVKQWYDIVLEKDVEMLYDMNDEQIKYFENVISDNKIDIIFRDAIDKFGEYIANDLNVPLISYSTHNLYSIKYLLEDKERFSLFFNCIYNDPNSILPVNYFDDYEEKSNMYHQKFSVKYNTYRLPILHQYNLNQEMNLIFSTDFFQPKESLLLTKQYTIIYPDVSEEMVNIESSLIQFLNKHKKIIYISSGSIMGHSAIYYMKFISNLKQFGYGIVVSCRREIEILKKWVLDKGYSDFVYLSDWIPQKFVLKYCALFITHGGNNSIMEAIYNGVPMLVTPTSSEQRINGLIVEEKGMGFTMVKKREKHLSVGQMINKILNTSEYYEKMHNFSEQYRKHHNDFSELDRYINEIR